MTPPAQPSHADRDKNFDFADAGAKPGFGQVMKKPSAIISILLGVAIVGLIFWLQQRSLTTELPPPRVSYDLLPNIGLTEGVPISIKLNQVAVFQISDPVDGSGEALRAKEVVTNMEGAIQDLVDAPGREITLDESGAFPTIIQSAPDGTGVRNIIQVTADDLVLAGMDDPKAVARLWAERLTDSLKVLMFGEAPEFSDENSEFRSALVAMYLEARDERGVMSEKSLEDSFEQLDEAQKLVLAELPARSQELAGEEPAP